MIDLFISDWCRPTSVVPFILSNIVLEYFQGLVFCLPYLLWKSWENNKLDSILRGCPAAVMDVEMRSQKIENLYQYFKESLNQHNLYAIKYFICELLNSLNIIFNIVGLNILFDNRFISLGRDLQKDTYGIFPTMSKCSLMKFGSNGELEKYDMLCLLPLNPIYSKIYLLLWWWFIVLACLTNLSLIYHLLVFLIPSLRVRKMNLRGSNLSTFSNSKFTKNLNFGDYFLLHKLSENIDSVSFNHLLKRMVSNDESDRIKLDKNA